MVIKEGFNSKPTHIKIYARENQNAEVWLDQNGLKDQDPSRYYETLAYATLEEIIALRDECNEVIKQMAGV